MKKLRCFMGKFTQLTKILHDCRSWRSRQISSLSWCWCWGTCWRRDFEADVWKRCWNWILVKISRHKIGLDCEVNIWSGHWGWDFVKKLKLNFCQGCEGKVWSWFWSWIFVMIRGWNLNPVFPRRHRHLLPFLFLGRIYGSYWVFWTEGWWRA